MFSTKYTTNSVGHASEYAYDEVTMWSPDRPVTDIAADSLGDLDAKHLTIRKLPIWPMADLYWQLQAWFESEVLLGADAQQKTCSSIR